MTKPRTRCAWPGEDGLMIKYHDEEWGVPEFDDRTLFEKLLLDGFQAGLSWRTILHKRDNFRRAFDGFDPEKIANYGEEKITALLADKGIVRNRLKVRGAVTSARAYLDMVQGDGDFTGFLWQFTEGKTLTNHWQSLDQIPAATPESEAMSRALKEAGFKFCGPTICYAFMQAVGMVNDHLVSCYRHSEV